MKKQFPAPIRSLSLVLLLLVLLSLPVGCKKSTGIFPNDSYEGVTTDPQDGQSVLLNLVKDGSTDYTIICAENASGTIKNKALELQQLLSAYTGAIFNVSTDLYNHYQETLPEHACEILIGDTNRPVSAEMRALISQDEYIIAEKNDRIIIMGGSDETTINAIDYFIKHHLTCDENITILQGSRHIGGFSYHLGTISIDGILLENYSVVVPKTPKTLFPYYAALNLIDYLEAEAGISLHLVYDDTPSTEHEIVIGETQRPESQSLSAIRLQSEQYILKKVGSSIYMYGKDYMVGGAISEFVNTYLEPDAGGEPIEIVGIPRSDLPQTFSFPRTATSALLLIGDGMGKNHIESTFSSRKGIFLAEYLEHIGTCTTFPYGGSASSTSYTDSAASSTALATGYKTKNKYLGVDHLGRPIQNVRELASNMGAKTAILTSDVITGATPAGFLCHLNSRKDTAAIQDQIDNVLENDPNLIYAKSVNDNKDDLLKETRSILYSLAHGNGTYFAMIEEAYIDKLSHDNNTAKMQECVLRYNDIIGYCIQFVMLHPKTALIITADHECGGLTLNSDGSFSFTSDNHTNGKVPVYAIGPETEIFWNTVVDNTDIGQFLISVYTDEYFDESLLN